MTGLCRGRTYIIDKLAFDINGKFFALLNQFIKSFVCGISRMA